MLCLGEFTTMSETKKGKCDCAAIEFEVEFEVELENGFKQKTWNED